MNRITPWQKISGVLLKIISLIAVFIILFPIFWLVRTSLIQSVYLYENPPVWWVKPTVDAYVRAFFYQNLFQRTLNSVIISISSTFAAMFLGTMAAYGITRFQMPFTAKLPYCFLFLRMLPPITTLLPIFLMFVSLNLIDSYAGMILIYTASAVPSVIWMMLGYYRELPREIEESAYIDGSSYFNTFLRIVVPITTPALASVAILIFTNAWNEFVMATILTRTRTITLPPGVVSLMSQTELAWDQISAGGVVLSIPVIILCVCAQKYFVQGLTVGAVKG